VSISLLDVNVLVALFDSSHVNHDAAHDWFGRNRRHGWATCPITLNGCIRVLSHPSYTAVQASPQAVAVRLKSLCSATGHHFWHDSVSFLDDELFVLALVPGYRQLTDTYLLGLAVRNHGRLATFDQSIPSKSVRGATPGSVVLIGKG